MIGPVVFVASWALAGATTVGYSSVDGAISDLAAVGASTHVAMTVAFVVFGIGLIAFGFALARGTRRTARGSPRSPRVPARSASPRLRLHGWSGDEVHGAFAVLGYAAIVGVPLLAAAPLAAAGQRGWARVSVVVAATSAVCLVATAAGPPTGCGNASG